MRIPGVERDLELSTPAIREASTALPTGTVTFLFTDIEGSTRLLKKLGRDRYGEVLSTHNRLLRAAFSEVDGAREVVHIALGLFGVGLGRRVGIGGDRHVVSWLDVHVGHIVRARVCNSHWGNP